MKTYQQTAHTISPLISHSLSSDQHDHLHSFTVQKRNGHKVTFNIDKITASIKRAARGFESSINLDTIINELIKNIFDGVETPDIERALVLATTPFIEKDPAYDFVAARLLLQKIYKEVIATSTTEHNRIHYYQKTFVQNIKKCVDVGFMDKQLLSFDLQKLALALNIERDNLFRFLGIQTLYEKYFLKQNGMRLELPQAFWMRVAMGLAIGEKHKNEKAIEFYNQLSTMHFMSSTPTLLHSGLVRPQLSSCFLTTVEDDLHHIFKCLGDNAQMSKWSGGVANDWTNLRSTGSLIKTVNIGSQGTIPFLKIANDITVAISRSGSRRGATVAYMEAWHLDFEDFIDLRRNTGDERRRTHDMNTAAWLPDLFMKRVEQDANWTLFSPNDVSDLHHLYGQEFEKRYLAYEEDAHAGKISMFKTVSAVKLWKKLLSRLFETGHPWITFKDPCNVRSPQDHVGVVHSSNLCTEITLNTNKDEVAVCNLGSINLARHIVDGKVDKDKLEDTIHRAIRMLDNVIDINFYPIAEAQNANMRHRPIGLGVMGLQDALFKTDIAFDSQEALDFVDETMEFISYHAIYASSLLAKERGTYESYKGSKWDRNFFPIDTIALLEKERGEKIDVNRITRMNWKPLRDHVKQYGMRNSNTMAIAPTATISNIVGSFPSIEPMYKNIYVKANMSGEFTIINHYLVNDLKHLGLWNDDMLDQIKYYDGNIKSIARIPDHLKRKYKEAFEINPKWLVSLTAVRGKWIDQSQSHNVFMKGVSGKKLSDIYFAGWKQGLKTFYYLRSMGASQIEKSTLDASKYGFTQKRTYKHDDAPSTTNNEQPKACKIEDPDCEACQ